MCVYIKHFFILQFVAKKTADIQSEFWSIPVSIADKKNGRKSKVFLRHSREYFRTELSLREHQSNSF